MKRTSSYWWIFGLFAAVVMLGILSQRHQSSDDTYPRAQFADGTPLGGKGLHLLLDSQGYSTKLQDAPIKIIPKEAKVWLLLDPQTRLSKDDAKVLLEWVKNGGTFIWCNLDQSGAASNWWVMDAPQSGTDYMRKKLHLSDTSINDNFIDPDKSLMPILEPAEPPQGIYGAGAHNVSISPNTFLINGKHDVLIGTKKKLQLAAINYGKGHIIISADALIFTNYGLAQGDNAILVSNLIGNSARHGAGIYFDQRSAIAAPQELPHTLLYYLWQVPLRWVWIQLLLAGLLLWAFYGRRLGKPMPIPVQEPVTRASQFAVAMASLYQKARRPKVALDVLGKEFRRTIVRRTGASPMDTVATLAARCSEMTGLPRERIYKLLEQLEKTVRSDAEVLRMTLEMEEIQKKLEGNSSS
ncbi:MAG: DUF4350 domain-containing protein [Abditibacteriaceae bacterium]